MLSISPNLALLSSLTALGRRSRGRRLSVSPESLPRCVVPLPRACLCHAMQLAAILASAPLARPRACCKERLRSGGYTRRWPSGGAEMLKL